MSLLLEAASPGRECRWLPVKLHRVDVEAKTIGNGAWPDVDAWQGNGRAGRVDVRVNGAGRPDAERSALGIFAQRCSRDTRSG